MSETSMNFPHPLMAPVVELALQRRRSDFAVLARGR